MTGEWRQALIGKAKTLADLNSHEARYYFGRWLMNHPYVNQQARKQADMVGKLGALLHDVSPQVRASVSGNAVREEHAAQITRDIFWALDRSLRRAEPMYMTTEVLHGIEAAMLRTDTETFQPFHTNMMPFHPGFVWFEQPMIVVKEFNPKTGDTIMYSIQSIFWDVSMSLKVLVDASQGVDSREGENPGLGVVTFPYLPRLIEGVRPSQENITGLPVTHVVHSIGETVAEYSSSMAQQDHIPDITKRASVWVIQFVRAMFRLMREDIIQVSKGPVDKAVNREAQRRNVSPKYKLVTWQRKVILPVVSEGEAHTPTEGKSIEWTCHWEVASHSRKLRSGKIIQVKGHTKGPPDKPLKPKQERVHVFRNIDSANLDNR